MIGFLGLLGRKDRKKRDKREDFEGWSRIRNRGITLRLHAVRVSIRGDGIFTYDERTISLAMKREEDRLNQSHDISVTRNAWFLFSIQPLTIGFSDWMPLIVYRSTTWPD